MKIYNDTNQLKSWLNPEASKVMQVLLLERESMVEDENVTFFLVDNSGEPTKFYEAYNHPETAARVKWWNAICE
jgi:hypothetical protein